MTGPRHSGERGGERGIVLIWFSIMLVVLVGITAVVIDLGSLRWQHRADRAAADFAASAGASLLQGSSETSAPEACQRAWDVFLENSGNAAPVTMEVDCTVFAAECDDSTTFPRTTTGMVGAFVVTITHPVVDDHELMQGTSGPAQGIEPAIDGQPCDRLGVRVERDRPFSFAQMLGAETGATDVHAVARGTAVGTLPGTAALLLLERTGCHALKAEGGGRITVASSPPDDEGLVSPGYIVADSDGLGCTEAYTLWTEGQNARIRAQGTDEAEGEIRLHALPRFATSCVGSACNPDDVEDGNVSPQPIASSAPLGRAPVDHHYNCKTSYDFDAPWTNLVPPCPEAEAASGPLDDLVATYQTGGVPPGFSTYPRPGVPGDSCSQGSNAPAITLPAGDWYFDCPDGLVVRSSLTVTDGHAVFEGGVQVTTNGTLAIRDDSGAGVVYLRGGDLVKGASGKLRIEQSFVYLHDGGMAVGGNNNGELIWTPPTAGDFIALALWSESTRPHSLAGQNLLDVRGVFFIPNAGYATSEPFTFSGGADGDMVAEAQLITHRLKVSGGGRLFLRPAPDEAIPLIPAAQGRLIR